MKCQQEVKVWMIRSILITLVAMFALPVLGQINDKKDANKATEPSVQITIVPPRGEGDASNGTIGGKVSGVNLKECKGCKVVIFTRTDKWYVQPTVASPYTPIGEDGQWETDIHLGYEYAALLVKSSYEPPATMGTLPKVAGAVLATARVLAKKE